MGISSHFAPVVLPPYPPFLPFVDVVHVQKGRTSQTYRQSSMQTRVFQIALLKGFPNMPHIPLPPEHSGGTNEATTTATSENPPCWHKTRQCRELCRFLPVFVNRQLHTTCFASPDPSQKPLVRKRACVGGETGTKVPRERQEAPYNRLAATCMCPPGTPDSVHRRGRCFCQRNDILARWTESSENRGKMPEPTKLAHSERGQEIFLRDLVMNPHPPPHFAPFPPIFPSCPLFQGVFRDQGLGDFGFGCPGALLPLVPRRHTVPGQRPPPRLLRTVPSLPLALMADAREGVAPSLGGRLGVSEIHNRLCPPYPSLHSLCGRDGGREDWVWKSARHGRQGHPPRVRVGGNFWSNVEATGHACRLCSDVGLKRCTAVTTKAQQ